MLYRYDEAGNLVQARDGHGATLRFQYDQNNRLTRWTDRLGYSFHFEYDAEGRCVHTFGDDGLFDVFLEYYPAQKCTIVRHADGGVWTYYYNDVGSLTEIRAPDCGTTRFNFDESGRVIEEVDPNGNVTTLLYDELGRHSLASIPWATSTRPPRGSLIATIRRNTRCLRRRSNGSSATYSIPPGSLRRKTLSGRSDTRSPTAMATDTDTGRGSGASTISTGT